jgi:hypothetical protein
MVWVPLHRIGGPARLHPVGRVDTSPHRRAGSTCRTRPPPRGSAPPAARVPVTLERAAYVTEGYRSGLSSEPKASRVGTAGVRAHVGVARPCVKAADARRDPASAGAASEAGGCPCSVREQPPTPAESNQERAANVVELSEVTDASWSLSLPQAGLKTGEATGPLPSPSMEFQSLRQSNRPLQRLKSRDCPCSPVARVAPYARLARRRPHRGCLVYSFDIRVSGKSGIDEVMVDPGTGKVLSHTHETPRQEAAEQARDQAARSKRR